MYVREFFCYEMFCIVAYRCFNPLAALLLLNFYSQTCDNWTMAADQSFKDDNNNVLNNVHCLGRQKNPEYDM